MGIEERFWAKVQKTATCWRVYLMAVHNGREFSRESKKLTAAK